MSISIYCLAFALPKLNVIQEKKENRTEKQLL